MLPRLLRHHFRNRSTTNSSRLCCSCLVERHNALPATTAIPSIVSLSQAQVRLAQAAFSKTHPQPTENQPVRIWTFQVPRYNHDRCRLRPKPVIQIACAPHGVTRFNRLETHSSHMVPPTDAAGCGVKRMFATRPLDLGLTTVSASMNPLGNNPERQPEAVGQTTPLSCHDAAAVGQPLGDGRSALPTGELCERHVLRIPRRPACAARIRNRHVPESWTESCFRSRFRGRGRARHSSWPRQVVTSQSRRNGQTQRRGGNGRLQNSAVIGDGVAISLDRLEDDRLILAFGRWGEGQIKK